MAGAGLTRWDLPRALAGAIETLADPSPEDQRTAVQTLVDSTVLNRVPTEKGEVHLSVNLPRSGVARYVRPWPLVEDSSSNLRTPCRNWISEIQLTEAMSIGGEIRWLLHKPDVRTWRQKAKALGSAALAKRLNMTPRNARRLYTANDRAVAFWTTVDPLADVSL